MSRRDDFTIGLLIGNVTTNSIAAFFTAMQPDVQDLWHGFAVMAVIFAAVLVGVAIARATGAA